MALPRRRSRLKIKNVREEKPTTSISLGKPIPGRVEETPTLRRIEKKGGSGKEIGVTTKKD